MDPGLIAGLILGLVMALAAQQWWWLPLGIALGLAVVPLIGREDKLYGARKKRDQNFRD